MNRKLNAAMKWLWICLILLMTGCTTHYDKFEVQKSWSPPATRLPLTVAVVADKELCSYTIEEKASGDTRLHYVGATICENIPDVFTSAFERAQVVQTATDPAVKNADAIVNLKIKNGSVAGRTAFMKLNVVSVVVMEWTITGRDGKLLYANTLTGNGNDARTFGVMGPRLMASMGMCLSDLMKKLYDDMLSPPVQQVAKALRQGKK
jgi:hypothetical protein